MAYLMSIIYWYLSIWCLWWLIGTSSGSILVFSVNDDAKESNIQLKETLTGHDVAITDLYSESGTLVSADELGNITIWKSDITINKVSMIKGFKYVLVCWYNAQRLLCSINTNSVTYLCYILMYIIWLLAIHVLPSISGITLLSVDMVLAIYDSIKFPLVTWKLKLLLTHDGLIASMLLLKPAWYVNIIIFNLCFKKKLSIMIIMLL